MTTPANELPVAIDYTSRDFYSLKNDLITRVQANVNVQDQVNWTGSDPTDFGVALVEAFAYIGDIVNYYIDRIANENYIGTATQRQSIIDLAKSYGYVPSGYQAASVTLQFHNSSISSAVFVAAGTQVSGQVIVDDTQQELVFTTVEDVTVPAATTNMDGSITAGVSVGTSAVHGELASTRDGNDPVYGEIVGISDERPSQSYTLSENQVVENSIQVYVEVGNGTDYALWQQVTHIEDSGPNDAVYTVETDADNFVTINFGDGVSGAIPTNQSNIIVNYYIGGGVLGNINSGVVDTIKRPLPGANLSYLTVANISNGSGGSDPESNLSIRVNAPRSLRALNRAVTLTDYANLALSVANVGKANAIADTKNSVTLYLAPQQSSSLTDLYPGYDKNPADGGVLNANWPSLVDSVSSFLSDKTQIGVSVSIAPPTYVPIHLSLRYTKMDQYTSAQVKAAIMLALVNAFSYSSLDFGAVITPEEVEYQVRQVPGVFNANVTILSTNVADSGRRVIAAGPGEIFVFNEENVYVTANATSTALTNFNFNVGWMPSGLTVDQPTGTISLPDSTTSLTLSVATESATMSVNGTYVVNDEYITIATPVGNTLITIVVTAQDGVTTTIYKVTAVRNA